MVMDTAAHLISFLEAFDSSDQTHHKIVNDLVEQYPHFYLIKPYFLKGIKENEPERYDEVLSHTAIASFDRHLLYEFLETQKSTPLHKATAEKKEAPELTEKSEKPSKKKASKKEAKPAPLKSLPTERSFSDWARYLNQGNDARPSSEIEDKFELFDRFLAKKRSVKPSKDQVSNEDLSAKSWASSDELMTETLAKVFVKQKKFENALQAYQILSLKYPEKNSFFADQIKEIKRLQKLKE